MAVPADILLAITALALLAAVVMGLVALRSRTQPPAPVPVPAPTWQHTEERHTYDPPQQASPTDLAWWRASDPIDLHAAAWLWHGFVPDPQPMPPNVLAVLRAMKAAIRTGRLVPAMPIAPNEDPNLYTLVARAELRRFAATMPGGVPVFLLEAAGVLDRIVGGARDD